MESEKMYIKLKIRSQLISTFRSDLRSDATFPVYIIDSVLVPCAAPYRGAAQGQTGLGS